MKARKNDRLRKNIPAVQPPNLLVLTKGVASLPAEEQAEILRKVRDFGDFNEGNDPYGEHDFGAFVHNGRKIFWKIDDYSVVSKEHNPDGYRLVLTVMLAEEY